MPRAVWWLLAALAGAGVAYLLGQRSRGSGRPGGAGDGAGRVPEHPAQTSSAPLPSILDDPDAGAGDGLDALYVEQAIDPPGT
jgi:hypothetical protein